MNQLTLQLQDDRRTFEPGEELVGSAAWSLDAPPRALELRLFWFTRGKGTEDVGRVESVRFDQPLPNETRSFRLRLPTTPYSFSGKLISLTWALELVTEPAGAVTRLEFLMGPDRQEVRLESVPPVDAPGTGPDGRPRRRPWFRVSGFGQ